MAASTDIELSLESLGPKSDFKEVPQHPKIQDLLDWELQEFTVRHGTIASSTSAVKTSRGGSKRKQSRYNEESPRADMSGTAPPRTATQQTGGSTAASTTKRHTTRATTTYDRHLRKDLILRSTTVLPAMTHDLALLCKGLLAANPPQAFPDDAYPFSVRGRSRAQPTAGGGKFFAVSSEAAIVDKCVYRQEAAVHLCSAALSTNGVWPDIPSEGSAPLLWYRERDPDQTKGLGDGFLFVDDTYLQDSERSASHQHIARALRAVCEQELSPVAVWEFKDIVCATLSVMLAIRKVSNSQELFPWIACSDWEKGLPYKTRCEGTGCNTPEGSYRVSGRCARFDSPIIEEFLCRVAKRKDIGLSSYKVAIKAGDLRTAILILQQIWSQLVTIDATVAVIHGGNYELICIRHRATQSLFLSDIHYIPGNRLDSANINFAIPGPTHMNLHTGLVSLITADALQRTKLIKAAEGIEETRLPSRMRNASVFNMSPWREGWHRDTNRFVSKKFPPLTAWKEGLDAFRKALVTSTRIHLRFCGTNAKLFSSENLDSQNALQLENVDTHVTNGEAPRTAPEINPTVGILRPPKKSTGFGGSVTCNLAVPGSSDRYYNSSFIGLLATNSDEVARLIQQFRVHQAFEHMGDYAAEKVQYHLGCFVNRDRSFGVLFLENIPEKAYVQLSDPNVQHTGLSDEVIREIEAFFDLPSFAHRSLMAWNIYVRAGSSNATATKPFYVVDWRYGKVWDLPLTAELRDDQKMEKAKDKVKLTGILGAVRRV